jgi:tRNA (guanine-N7-)-methyltransferase
VKRIRNHVNPLRYAQLATDAVALPDDGEVEVELGCADAQFLFERARACPDATCIGVEIREELVHDVNARARAEGLDNLRAVYANVSTDLPSLFPDERLARVYLNFPDPWFKRRHHKRRVLTPDVVATLHRQLAPGGQLLFQSDVFELALEAMTVLEMSERLANARGAWSFLPDEHPFAARSLREERCVAKGVRVWRMLYERSASAR